MCCVESERPPLTTRRPAPRGRDHVAVTAAAATIMITTTTSLSRSALCIAWLILMLHHCSHNECWALAAVADNSFSWVT